MVAKKFIWDTNSSSGVYMERDQPICPLELQRYYDPDHFFDEITESELKEG